MRARNISSKLIVILGVLVWCARKFLILFLVLLCSPVCYFLVAVAFEANLPVSRGWKSELTEPAGIAEIVGGESMSYEEEPYFHVDEDQRSGVSYILCQYEDRIFYVTAKMTDEDHTYIWTLASEKEDNKDLRTYYSGQFVSSDYKNFSVMTEELYAKNPLLSSGGMYYNGAIYLFDHTKVVKFDIESEAILENTRDGYVFPQTEIWVEITDDSSFQYGYRNNDQKEIFTLERLAEQNEYARELLSVNMGWQTYGVCDDRLYLSLVAYNSKGYKHTFVFELGLEQKTVAYMSHSCYLQESLEGYYYLVPVIRLN